MNDSFEFNDSFEVTLHSPLTKEDWNKILDVEHEKTRSITFQTPQGKQVRYIKCDVLSKIKTDIEQLKLHKAQFLTSDGKVYIDSKEVLKIIDKYKAESED